MSQLVPTSLRIGIIGAGNIGEPLARFWTQAGHTVSIANSRGPDTLTDVAQRTGAAATTIEGAVKGANLVVVTIPQKAVPHLAAQNLISQLPADTIVIDTGNYYSFRDGQIAEFESESIAESRWVEQQLGHAVVKVFNNIYFHSLSHLGKPAGTPGRIALPVVGDNTVHKATVIALLEQLGFDGVDAGTLDDSWRQQPGTPVYCTDLDVAGLRSALARADRSRSHTVRDLQIADWHAAMEVGEGQEQMAVHARALMTQQYGQ